MEIKNARVLQVLPIEQGESARGAWQKQTIVFEYGDRYPKKTAVEFLNKAHIVAPIQVGMVCDVDIDVESREYNGRWYTQASGFGVVVLGQPQYAQAPPQQAYAPAQPQPPVQPPQYTQAPPQQGNNLPF